MRQRKLKNLDERLEHFKNWIVNEPEKQKGRWKDALGEDVQAGKQKANIRLEIGCGKGRFITEKAFRDPENKYIGIEGQESVIVRAIEKAEKKDLNNIMFISGYVRDLREIFADEEVRGIYLFFSDPWPKKRHASRRLTHRNFLASYKAVLAPGGSIEIRTDNKELFDFTLCEAEAAGLFTENITEDLHGSDIIKDGIMTEYEEKFSSMGKKIKYVKLIK